MRALPLVRVALGCSALLMAAGPANAQPQRSTYVDLTAGAGYSSNPFFDLGDDTGSAFGRLSAYGVHAWTTERSQTSLSAYLENSFYFDDYGNKPIFDLGANTSYQSSETVRLFGQLNFSGDFAGQLGTRFVTIPDLPTATPEAPILPPVTVVDPELQSLRSRQFRLAGQVGAAIRPNARDTWTIYGGAQRLFYTGDASDLDYTTYSLTGAYDRQLSERVTVGFRTSLQHSRFESGGSTTLVNPQVTATARLAEVWDATLAAGVIYSVQDLPGADDDNGLGLSLDGSLCRSFERSRLCGRLSRSQTNNIGSDLLTTTSAGVDYSHRIDRDQSFQLAASLVRYSGQEVLGDDTSSTYFSTSGSYNRQLNERMAAGVNASVRKLSQFGPDPKLDASASVFLRYRLGDLQ